MRAVKRKTEIVGYSYTDGYPYDTIQEVKDAIDKLFVKAASQGISETDMGEALNTS